MNETLDLIERFHGHLGPYVLLGYRMGLISNEKIGKDPFCKNAVVFSGTKPPLSCIVDGIQLSSGCTLGKGNIKLVDNKEAMAEFSNNSDKKFIIKLRDNIRSEIDKTVTEENMISYSQNLWIKNDEELFEIL